MTESSSGDARIDSAEEQMRHALGLHGDTPRQSTTDRAPITTTGQRRRFVRDGEVPVTVLHRHQNPDADSTNQLDAARQAIRSQAAGREHAERLLEQAQATVRSLQTALAHERLAKDEAIQRAEVETQLLKTARAELLAERAVRDRLGRSLSDSVATIQDLQRKLDGARAELATERQARQNAEGVGKMPVEAHEVAAPANRDGTPVPTVRRPVGRPRKTPVLETVEKPVPPSGKAQAGDMAVKVKGLPKPDRATPRPAGKPIKWWLTGRKGR